jgi:SAM-dependent methyltransferase
MLTPSSLEIKLKFGRSKSIPFMRIPIISAAGQEMSLGQAVWLSVLCWPELVEWKIESKESDCFVVSNNNAILRLRSEHFRTTIREWGIWKKTYLPNFPLTEKTVLDVGAGCGETAQLFFTNGAKKVIAIESNNDAINDLRINGRVNKWNLQIVARPFQLEDLERDFDFLKMDIEGCEESLLKSNIEYLKPSVIEVHRKEMIGAFRSRFQMRVVHRSTSDQAVLSNW